MKKETIVLGASLKPDRYSHRAVIRLSAQQHPVIAVGLKEGKVGAIDVITFDSAFAKAETLKETVHTITLYLNPKRQVSYYDFICDIAPKRVIFNPGTENPKLVQKLVAAGIEAEVACTLVLLATDQY